jgi:hypothetical protein
MRRFAMAMISAMGWCGVVQADTTAPIDLQPLWNDGSIASPAGAQPAAQQGKPSPDDPERIVCREMPPTTGTRLGSRRICSPQRLWDDKMREDQARLSHSQSMGFQLNQTPSN